MHVLCGESLCSHLGATLKLGTTALIVALVEAGLRPGTAVQLRDPLVAIRRFSSDLTLRVKAELTDGRSVSALDLQQHYLEFVEKHLRDGYLPPWAEAVCALWRDTLSRLRQGPSAVETRLDWAIKSVLFTRQIQKRGVSPAELADLNQVLESQRPRLPRALSRGGQSMAPAAAELPPVASNLPRPPRLSEFLQLRAELGELDIHFSKLGPESLFSKLEQAGVLHHRVGEITPEGIRESMTEPPRTGRAHLRGRAVKELHGSSKIECDWAGIVNRATSETLDLSNPMQQEMPAWSKRFTSQPRVGHPLELLASAREAYNRGAYSIAYTLLCDVERVGGSAARGVREEVAKQMHRVQTRRGFHAEAIAALFEWSFGHGNRYTHAVGFTFSHKFHGLTPTREASTWVEKAETLLAQGAGVEHAEAFELQLHKAGIMLHAGKWQEAQMLFQQTLEAERGSRSSCRNYARAMGELAETHRRLGDTKEAERCLADAEETQMNSGFMGDYAEFTLTCRAKLDLGSGGRLALAQATDIQSHLGHHLGQARTICLWARIMRDPTVALRKKEQLLALREQAPSLRSCALFSKITAAWDDWVAGRQPAGERDFFWGL